MDNILLFSKTSIEHKECTQQILQKLWDHDLFLKPEKCSFNTQRVEFLGLVIIPGQIHMDLVKVEGIVQ